MAKATWYDEYKKKNTKITSGQTSTNWYDAYKKETEESDNWVTRYQNDIVGRVNSLLSSHNSQINAHNNRFSGRKENIYDNDYVSDAGDWYADSQKNYSAYDKEASDLLSSIEGSSLFGDEWVKSVTEAINGQRGQQKSMLDAAKSDNDFWSSFSSEDNLKNYGTAENAYKAAVSNKKDYDTKSKADISALQVDYDHFLADQQKFSDYNNAFQAIRSGRPLGEAADALVSDEEVADYVANGMSYQKAKEQYIQQKYAGYVTKYFGRDKLLDAYRGTFDPAKEMNNLGKEKKSYLESAKDIQKAEELKSVINNEDFNKYSGYDENVNGVDLYDFINKEDGATDLALNLNPLKNLQSGSAGYKVSLYENMTDEEVSIFNYYASKYGEDKASEYLDSLEATLAYRKAENLAESMEGNTALELLFAIPSALDRFDSGVRSLFSDEKNTNAIQIAAGNAREDLPYFGRVLFDTGSAIGYMLPSILTSTAIGLLNPTAGVIAGNALTGASAAGNAYQEMINLGYSKQQAGAYGAMVGGSEALLSYALGGISALNGGNGGIFGSLVDDVLPAMDNAIARAAIQIGGNMLDEGLEEGIQEILDPWFKNLTLQTNEKVNWNDVAYSTLLGALTAGFMEGPATIAGEVNTYKTGKKLQDGGIKAERLAKVGHTFAADSVAYQLADKVTENTDAYTLGRLFNEIDATITQQNVDEISRELVKTGWDANLANYMANTFAQVVEGAEFSDGAIAAIEANDQYAQVLKSVLIDSNTTWNQRSVGYNAAVKALADSVANPKSQQTKATKENAPTEGAITTETKTAAQVNTDPSTQSKKVTKIADIGKKTVTTEDGKTVSVKDAAVSADDQMRIDTIASIENITTDDANYILNTLRTRDGASSKVDSLAAKEAYKYGYYGFSKDHIAKHGSFASYLTGSQFDAIYKLGQQARQAKANKMPTKTVGPKGGIFFDKGGGEIVALKDVDKAAISGKKRSAGVQAAMVLHKLGIGGDIYFYESYRNENGKRVYKDSKGKEVVAPNGFFQGKDNSIHIDLNAGTKGEGLVLFTLAHELTHFVEKWSPQKYKILADFLVENYEKGRSVDELVLAKQADLASKGQDVSYDKAFSEVVADSMEAMLADGNVIEKIRELKAKDKDLFDKIKEFFDNLLAKIRSVYQGLTPDSAEGQAVLQMKDSIEKIQQLFAEGLVEASENFQNALVPGEDSVVVNDNGDPVAHATEDGTVQLSMRTYEESGRAELRKYLEKCVKNKSLTKTEMQEMLDGIEEIYTTCKEFKDKYAPFGSWSDAAVVRDTHGKPVFSVVTPNGEYKMNLDFSLVCKKRRTLDAVFNEMSKRGIIDDFELGQKSIVKINEIIRKYGLETACALCFVDAKRFRQADVADSFVKLYNDLVQSLVPESKRSSIGYFDFAGYGVKSAENGIHTWKNADLDFSHINYVLKNYGSKTVEHKAAAYIKENADARKQLLRGDFMSSTAFDAVKSKNPTMMKLYNSKKGTGGPKAAFGDVQYMNEIIRNSRGWSPKKAFEVGGVRVQSFSDYVPRMVFDYVQMVYDMAAKRLPAHSYSKEAIFVKQFGLTGIKINMSLIPAVVDGGIAPGLDAKGNYVWAGESFNFETAKQIQKQKGYTENCGTICVGVSYDHIMKLLDDPDIRMVIPYHKSGLNPIVAHMNKVSTFTDYTSLSTNPKGCQSTINRETGSKVEKDFNFNDELRKVGDPKVAAQNYLDWCYEEHNYMPKFEEFASHENYYKLLTDFTVYDADGNYVAQREVTATFPTKESAFGDMKFLIESGLEEDAIIEGRRDKNLSSIVDEIQRTIPKTEAEIAEEQVEQADRDVEADTQYSIREEFYKEFDAWDGKNPSVEFTVGTTSDALKSVGVKEQEIKLRTGVILKKINKHPEITRDIFKQIPGILERPVIVQFSDAIDPKTKKPRHDSSITVLGELYADVVEDGRNIQKPVLVSLELLPRNQKNTVILDFVLITSAYSKDALQRYINENSILYIDPNKKRTDNWLSLNRLQLPVGETNYGSIRRIAYVDGKVKVQSSKNMTDMQRKLFEAGKIDEFGNWISTSRDADGDQSQYRADDSVSNRSLLANAFEGVAKNDIEKKRIQEYKDNIDSLNAEERKLQDLNKQIKELSFAKGKRDTQQIKDLQEEARKTANRIDTYDKRLLRLEASAPLQRVLERERTKAYKKAEQKGMEVRKAERERAEKAYQKTLENLRESKQKALEKAKENREKSEAKLKEQFKESRERASENRTKTAIRHKIQGVVGELNQLLKADDKKRHIPDSLKKAVAEALALVNMDNLSVDKRVAEINKRLAELYDKKAKAEQSGDQLLADEIQVDIDGQLSLIDRYTKMSDKLQKLQSAYEDIKNSNDPDIASGYDPVIAGSLKELAESIGDTPLAKMSVDQLQDVYDMYKMVLTRVRDANKSLVDTQREAIKTRATKVVGEVKRVGGAYKFRVAALDFVKRFGWDNLKPVYAFEHIGSDTLTEAFNDVRKGEDTWAKDVTDARKFYLDKAGKYHYDSWDFDKKHSFESASGIKFDLTLEQILSLYAYSKRDQALEHLRLGGFVFDSNIETYKEKGSKLIKYKVNTADAHQITPEILADITGLLTKEQIAFVDEMQDYLSTTMGAKGNEVTMKMYGVKLFKEKFYFPLKSAKQFVFEQNEVAGEVRIKNSGFTNKTKPNANNPVILNNFMDVWTGHVNDMSMYHAFTLPLEDFNRIFNYESGKQEGIHPVSVKGTIQNAYGPAAVSYVRQLITDLNGGAVADPRESTAKALMAKFKKAKVFTSFSVVVQQPSSIARAFALIDPKYFRPTKDGMSHKELWNEVKQYAPVAIIKEMGYFDTNMGRSASEYIQGKEYSGFTEKLKAFAKDGSYRDEVMSRLPALADEMSWCAIWNAVKRETVHNHQNLNPGSKEFLEVVGERFTEVITKTQVYDSVLARSGNMRSKTGFMNMATSFMAEPTTTINMLQDAIVQKARGKKKYAGRVFGSVLASIVLNNVLVSFVYAGRDDDEDETYIEKYLQSFVSGMLDDVNPITYYPFLKDMWSVLQGFDVERTDMSLFSDLADSMKAIVKAYNTDGGDVGGAWLDATGAAANLTGIPIQNIRREINAAINFYKTLFKDFNGRATTGKSLGNALVDSVRDTLPVVGWFPGKNKAAKLYDALVSGDDTYADRLVGSYKDEDAANSAIRSAIKKSYESGDIDEDTAMEHLVEYGGLENEKEESYYKKKAEDNDMTVQQYKEFELKNDAYWKLEEWKYEAESEDDFSKYDDFLSAVKTGKNLKKVVKEYTDHGVSEETLASQITKHYKPLYKNMSNSERAAIKGYLLNAYALLGYNRAKKSRDINDWLKD